MRPLQHRLLHDQVYRTAEGKKSGLSTPFRLRPGAAAAPQVLGSCPCGIQGVDWWLTSANLTLSRTARVFATLTGTEMQCVL